jgi:hypothetical protein
VGKTDGADKASRELTSRNDCFRLSAHCALVITRPYQSAAKKWYLADILPKNANIYIHPLPAGELSMDCARHARLARR